MKEYSSYISLVLDLNNLRVYHILCDETDRLAA